MYYNLISKLPLNYSPSVEDPTCEPPSPRNSQNYQKRFTRKIQLNSPLENSFNYLNLLGVLLMPCGQSVTNQNFLHVGDIYNLTCFCHWIVNLVPSSFSTTTENWSCFLSYKLIKMSVQLCKAKKSINFQFFFSVKLYLQECTRILFWLIKTNRFN